MFLNYYVLLVYDEFSKTTAELMYNNVELLITKSLKRLQIIKYYKYKKVYISYLNFHFYFKRYIYFKKVLKINVKNIFIKKLKLLISNNHHELVRSDDIFGRSNFIASD